MNDAHDEARLMEVLAATGPVLLDFDGPVCNVYPGDLNIRAADRLRALLRQNGFEVTADVEQTSDPLAVLRYAGGLDDAPIVTQIEQALTSIEVDAITTAPETLGADDFLEACAAARRPVVIVSNNSTDAIRRYLGMQRLSDAVHSVVGRPHSCPQEMKPHPRSLRTALESLHAPESSCVLVGDSVTDIQAARAVGLSSIAYVKGPERRDRLIAERPDALVNSMAQLARAIRRPSSARAADT